MKLSDLTPHPGNPRKISDQRLEMLKRSLLKFGDLSGILFNRQTGRLVGGHQRAKVLPKDAPIELIELYDPPTSTGTLAEGWVILEGERFKYREVSWDETTEKAANIAANQHGGEWEIPALNDWLLELDAQNFDMDLTGFTAEDLEGLMAPIEKVEPQCDEDETPGLKEEPITKLGDIYQLGRHRLMCGDSTSLNAVEALMNGMKAEVVFTDPPYGYKYESNHQDKHAMLINDDTILDFMPCAYAVMADDSAIYVCGSHQTIHQWRPMIDQHFAYKNLIVWKKNNWSMGDLKGAFAGQHELIIFAHKGRVTLRGERSRDVWEFDRDPPEHHPTQKPIPLVEMAIEKVSDRGAHVLDLFGGSGSTLIACEKTGRTAYLMELDPKYCDVIISRFEKYSGQKAVLLNGPST